MTQVSTPRSL